MLFLDIQPENMYRYSAIRSLLEVYERTIDDFKKVIEDIPPEALTIIIDTKTADEKGNTIQGILSQVITNCYDCATRIYNVQGHSARRPDKAFHINIHAYLQDLTDVLSFTEKVFSEIKALDLEEFESMGIKTSLGKLYEQIIEHSIVYILRHKILIEKIKAHQPGVFNK